MKTVHTSEMVAHLWANQSQTEARNSNKSFYFREHTIYSYGNHFPIAKFHKVNGVRFILFTTKTYSSTTQRHVALTNRAIADGITVIACDNVRPCSESDHLLNLSAMKQELIDLMNKAARARSNFGYLNERMEEVVWRYDRYRRAFQLEKVSDRLAIPEDWKAQAQIRLKEQAEKNKARKEQRKREEQAREQALLADMWNWIEHKECAYSAYHYPVIQLRLKDAETVQTSRGAELPVLHARKLWDMIQEIKCGDREEYYHNGHSLHAGSFVVQYIKRDGSLRAGCHDMTYEAMEGFANRMHWPVRVKG